MHAVEVNAKASIVHEKSVTIKVYCNYTVISDVGVNITVNVNEDGSQNQALTQSILCLEDKPNTVTFSDLRRNTAYFSFVSWTSNECMLSTILNFTTVDGSGKINVT